MRIPMRNTTKSPSISTVILAGKTCGISAP
jgi:hypothetical protein